MRIVVTGGRHYTDGGLVFAVLALLRPTHVAQGGARGCDALVREWCHSQGVKCRTYPANWDAVGRAAGPIRNREMLATEAPDLVLAFPGAAGTADCKRQARAMGLIVLEAVVFVERKKRPSPEEELEA